MSQKSRHGTLLLLSGLLLTMVGYQNCAGSGPSAGGGSTSTASTSTSTGTGTGGGSTLPLETIQARCAQAIGKPVLSSVSNMNMTVVSALGINNSGDKSTGAFTVTGQPGITDTSVFNDGIFNCQTRVNVDLRCEVVTGEAARPITITQALDASGSNLATGSADLKALAQKAIRMQDCQVGFNPGENTLTLNNGIRTLSNDLSNGARCVSGSFYLKMSIRNGVTGVTDNSANRNSDPQYVKINVQNGCWKENRLKAGSEFPAAVGFGTRAAIDGVWAVVLAPTENISGGAIEAGSANLFKNENGIWNFKQKIFVAGAANKDNLTSVAIQGDNLVLGSAYRGGTGAVFLFKRGTNDQWAQVGGAVNRMGSQSGEEFGSSVAIAGNVLAVGAPKALSGTSTYEGSVSLFSISSSGLAYLMEVPQQGDRTNKGFGTSLAFNSTGAGPYLAIGAPMIKTKEYLGTGEVQIFQVAINNDGSGGSSFVKKITTSSGAAPTNSARFGASVAFQGNQLVIGAPGMQIGANASQGRVYYYANYTQAAETKTFDGAAASDNYGASVALNSLGLFVGAPNTNSLTGVLNYFDFATYTKKVVIATNSTANNAFGTFIAVSNRSVIVGAAKKSDPQNSSGAAYAFEM